jgi:hypothetical protein
LNCDKCKAAIKPGEEFELHGQVLCEDCYMDALSPPRACDPWAVHSVKSFTEHQGGSSKLTLTQQRILDILKQTGGVPLDNLARRLKIKPSDLEREIAALRHMEKVRGALKNGQKIICLW